MVCCINRREGRKCLASFCSVTDEYGPLPGEDTFRVVVVRPGTATRFHRKFIFLFFLAAERVHKRNVGTEITTPSGMRTIYTVKSPTRGKKNLEFSLFPLSCMRNHGVSCSCGSSLVLVLACVASWTRPTL